MDHQPMTSPEGRVAAAEAALRGKAIVITGAGGGLGTAYARHAASLGAAVLVNDVSPDAAERVTAEIRAAGGRAVAHAADVSQWDSGAALVAACIDAFGHITGLVNNAGVLRPQRLEELTEAELARLIRVNLFGTAACAQATVLAFRRQGTGGSVVNVVSGSHAGDVALGAYAASKGAVASLTYSWAMELRGSPIRMNAVSPLAETAMAAANAPLMGAQSAAREVVYHSLPDPQVNAPLVSYLLSDLAGEVHGQIVRIAGRQLSLVTHPMIASPVLEDDWTFDSIAAAFAERLGQSQQRLGLVFAQAAP